MDSEFTKTLSKADHTIVPCEHRTFDGMSLVGEGRKHKNMGVEVLKDVSGPVEKEEKNCKLVTNIQHEKEDPINCYMNLYLEIQRTNEEWHMLLDEMTLIQGLSSKLLQYFLGVKSRASWQELVCNLEEYLRIEQLVDLYRREP